MHHDDITLFTIDEPHSRDLDDAVGIARNGSGLAVRIAIANPAALVAIGSSEDLAARKQGATIYRGRSATEPMLPRSISEARATLTAGERRAAMLIDLELDGGGQIRATHLSEGTITVAQRLSYRDVPAIAEDRAHPLHIPMVDAISLARGLLKQRRARGALAIYDQRQSLLTDEEGRVRHYDAGEMVGHILVQELMVAGNTSVAEFAARNELPFLYRCHEPRISAPRGAAAAESLETWIAGGHASAAAAAERLSLIAQKARYTSTLTGHYGLNVPAYAHITSPLRRYADLVDQRQLIAFVRGTALPYSQDDLTAIGNELFEAAEALAQATSESYKAPLLARAQFVIESNTGHALRSLADNELGQAVKAALAEGFAPPLADELRRRMRAGILADKVSVRFIEGRSSLPPAVADAFIGMVADKPASAMSFVNHARAIGAISDFDVEFQEVAGQPGAIGPAYQATVTMRDADRRMAYTAVAVDVRKKAAEQAATLQTLCDFMGVPRPTRSTKEVESPSPTAPAASSTSQLTNSKGALLELCQKSKLGMPSFSSTSSGPANAPTFICVVELAANGRTFTARSPETSTKKQAEALAAEALLEQVSRGPGQKDEAQTAAAPPSNAGWAIQQLQEYAQKSRLAPPAYEFTELSKTPSTFECRVQLSRGTDRIEYRATAASKQASKAAAAAGALNILSEEDHPSDDDSERPARMAC
jgi:ribonuclease R